MDLLKKNTIVFLIIITILGIILRVYHLGTEDLWLDEIFSIEYARQSIFTLLPDTFAFDRFPFNTLLIHFPIKYLGESPEIIRFPSCLFGILAIPVLFLLGKKLFNTETGLWASYFLAISPYHIYYSQEARPYTLQIFVLLILFYIFLKLMETNKTIYWILFLFLEILSTYIHLYSSFMLLGLNIYFLWNWYQEGNKKERLLNWAIIHFIYLMIFIPWLLVINHYNPWIQAKWIPPVSYKNIIETLYNFSTGITEMDLPLWILWVGSLIFLFCLSIPILLYIRREKSERNNIFNKIYKYGFSFTLAILLLPIMVFYLYSLKVPSYLAWRYLIIALPGFYLLTAFGIYLLRNRYLQFTLVILITLVYGFCIYQQFSKPHKISLRKPAEYIQSRFQENDGIMIIPSFWSRSLTYYYPDVKNLILPYDPSVYPKESKNAAEKYNRIWLIEVPPYFEPFPLAEFISNHELQLLTPTRGVRLTLYSNPP